jgi:hypothetical protein
MNNKTIAKWFSALLLLMVVGVNSAFAQKITVDPLSMAGGDTKDLTIKLASESKQVYGFQVDVVLPEGFTVDDDPEIVEGTMTNGKEKEEEVKGDPIVAVSKVGASTYRIMAFSDEGLFFNAKAEKILTVEVTASGSFAEDTEMVLTNTFVATDNKGTQVKQADQKVKVLAYINPNGPLPVFSPLADDGETIQYLFNVEAKAFLASHATPNNDKGTSTACYQWDTHAAVLKEKGYEMKVTANGDGTWSLKDHEVLSWRDSWNEYDCKPGGDIWSDGGGRPGAGQWVITPIGDNLYKIGNKNVKGNFGAYPSLDDIGVYVSEDKALGTTWAFVNEKDYKDYLATYEKWLKNIVPTLKASKEPGTNITPAIGNICTSVTGWKISNESKIAANYWSNEGASDGSGMTVNFLENWVSKPGPLPEGTLTYTIEGLVANQKYKVTAFMRAYNEGSDVVPTGAYFYANDQKSDDIAKGTQFTYNKMAGVYMRVSLGVDADKDGKIVLGIVEKGNNFNWIALRDVQVSVYDESNPYQELIDEMNDLVAQALEIINQGEVPEAENKALKDAVKGATNAATINTEKGYQDAIAALEEAIEAADAVNVNAAKEAALAALAECQPVGGSIFQYSKKAVDAAKAAIEAATSVDEVNAVKMPVMTAPVDGQAYKIVNNNAEGLSLAVSAAFEGSKVHLEKNASIYFTAVEGGYAISNADGEYIATPTSNNWTFEATTELADAYVVSVEPVEGGYNLSGAKGVFGTDDVTEGSSVWANKASSQADKNVVWSFIAPVLVLDEDGDYYAANLLEDGKTPKDWTIDNGAGNGNFHINTWSVEGDKGEDGAGMKVPFIEYWKGTGNNLDNGTIAHNTIEGLKAGSYTVQIFVRAFNEGNATDYPSGISIYANDASVDLAEVGTQALYQSKSTVLYGVVPVECTVGEDGKLDLGFKLEDVQGDWIAFKDLKVYYNSADGSSAGQDKWFTEGSFKVNDYPDGETKEAVADPRWDDEEGCIIVTSNNNPSNDYDAQFFVVLPEKLVEGDVLTLTMKVKADRAQSGCGAQAHNTPGDYNHWACVDGINFTTEWADYESTITVSAAMEKGQDGNGTKDGFGAIAFNLSDMTNKTSNNFYFDDVVVTYTSATGLVSIEKPATKANGKYFENGKVVIIKNGVKYNVGGVMIK